VAKAKGTTLIAAVKFLRRRKEEAREKLPQPLHHYLEERVSSAQWYPEEDLQGLIRAILDLLPGSRETALELMGRQTATRHSEGIYAKVMAQGANANSAFALWSTMHDTGELSSTPIGDGQVRIELRGYACPSPEFCAITQAYIAETFRLGGQLARMQKERCRCRGDAVCAWLVTLA